MFVCVCVCVSLFCLLVCLYVCTCSMHVYACMLAFMHVCAYVCVHPSLCLRNRSRLARALGIACFKEIAWMRAGSGYLSDLRVQVCDDCE